MRPSSSSPGRSHSAAVLCRSQGRTGMRSLRAEMSDCLRMSQADQRRRSRTLRGSNRMSGGRNGWVAAFACRQQHTTPERRGYYKRMLTAHGVSHRGRVRSTNEDAWLSALDLGLFVVADGMGGQNAGEVASAMAVDTIRGFVEQTSGSAVVTWPFGVDPRLSPGANRVLTALKLANRCVFQSGEDVERRGMGTTVVAVLVEGQQVIYVSVGDSRIYSWRRGELRQLTADDSWVSQFLANQPAADPALLRHHPMRSVLTNVVGPKETLEFTVHERPLDDRGEVLLLCSDGLHSALADSEIGAILSSGAAATAIADQRGAAALDGPAAKNIPPLVIRFDP